LQQMMIVLAKSNYPIGRSLGINYKLQ
jgi:hypothetical protein